MNKKAGSVTTKGGELDMSIKPTDDFFNFVNGTWRAQNPIPPTEKSWGSFDILQKKNLQELRVILEELRRGVADVSDREVSLLRGYYVSAMDAQTCNDLGVGPLLPVFQRIDAIQTIEEMVLLVAQFHRDGISALFPLYAYRNLVEADVVEFALGQGVFGLPDKIYYVSSDKHMQDMRRAYEKHVQAMFLLSGLSRKEAHDSGRIVLEIETAFASASRTSTELRQIEKTLNPRTLEELERDAPAVPWQRYFKELGAVPPERLNVEVPEFVIALSHMLEAVPLSKWKAYLRWMALLSCAGALSDDFVKERFNFYGRVLSGVKKMKPRWERVIPDVNNSVGEILGKLYVKRHFSEASKMRVRAIVQHLRKAYEARIASRPWMGEATKERARAKLRAVEEKIGYPDTWRDYTSLELPGGSYLENRFAVNRFDFDYMLSKVGKPQNREEWYCPPQTVNAFFEGLLVSITFPAAVLQPPFFDPDADEATNFGAIGMIIGHELTHGFDDQGAKFDAKGYLKDWWTPEDRAAFEERAREFTKQIGTYRIVDDIHANGELTLGEAVADLGGITLAYHAMQEYFKEHGRPENVDGSTPEQRFFFGLARAWRDIVRDEHLRESAVTDPHLPPYWRINGMLSNMTEFFSAFDGGPGDKMWRPVNERVEIW
ncbi:MAG: M13 family metallopeptidase [Parcubacteria group bacterium]|nr:M13 family metallopeptidase [Parcubacteria group bacterium]